MAVVVTRGDYVQRMLFDPSPDLNVTIDAFEAAFRCGAVLRVCWVLQQGCNTRTFTQRDGL